MARKLIVGITQGDGNGISYEVIIKALADERILDMCTPVIYGSSKIFGFYKKHIHNKSLNRQNYLMLHIVFQIYLFLFL